MLKHILAEKEAEHQRNLEETKRVREQQRKELEESRAKLLAEQKEREELQKAAAEVREDHTRTCCMTEQHSTVACLLACMTC